MNARLMLIAATLIEFAIGASAYAQTAEDTHSVIVHYSDLNVRSAVGRNALERRLVNAARDVCAMDIESTSDLTSRMAQATCIRHAMLGAHVSFEAKMAAQFASR